MSQRRAKRARQTVRDEWPPESRLGRLLGDRRVWIGAGVLALVAVLGVGIVVARGTGAAEPIVEQSGKAVSFSGSDPVTGKQVSLDDYAGKPVVLNVWGSWCPGASPRPRTYAASPPTIRRCS